MIDITLINVIAELERIGYVYEFASENEIKCLCPFHQDKTPSCHVNIIKRVFKCHTAGCEKSGSILSFLAGCLKTTIRVIIEDLSTRYDFEDATKTLNSTTIEKYHTEIWSAKPMLVELRNRGITDALIRQYRLGWHNGRITIPITNEHGLFVNIRRYLPGAPGAQKMVNLRGHGKPIRLFPFDQLKYEKIIICAGELKAIACAHLTNQHEIGAIACTGGESNWEPNFSDQFVDKHVWVLFDIDQAGKDGAQRICARIHNFAKWIGAVQLPLDADKYPKGDISDLIGLEKVSSTSLLEILNKTKEWIPTTQIADETIKPEETTLANAIEAKRTGKRVKLKAMVSAMDPTPYVVPKTFKVICDKNQSNCAKCPAFVIKKEDTMALSPETDAILEMVASPKKIQRDAIMNGLGIPTCKVVEFEPIEWFNVEDVRLSPQLDITARGSDDISQPALCVGYGLELNDGYEFTGRMYPHPKTQQSTLVISKSIATQDALSAYTTDDLGDLCIFQSDDIQVKLDDIYEDFEANVTRIFQRRDMHLLFDLAYHSPLLIYFDERIEKGWVEVLIMGDSSQGKSETAKHLMSHYTMGVKWECKNATVAGLLGGLAQLGTKWFVTWGIIPTHDRRLVILEELKGASTEIIGKLTDMRSSGVAELPKIEKRRKHARTRIIALSNPRSDLPLSSYNYGVDAIKELIGGLEDVRRFDAILLVSSTEVNLDELQNKRPKIDHVYNKDVCKKLILWSWTRRPEDIHFVDENTILEESRRLCSIFTESIPLCDKGSMRFKLARLSASLACRLFSTEDHKTVLIQPEHVQYISNFLERIYMKPITGYRDYSLAEKTASSIVDPSLIRRKIGETPFPKDLIQQLLHTNEIEMVDLQDWCGWERGFAQQLLSFLVRKHCLIRKKRHYRKSSEFIDLLKSMNLMDNIGRPEYIDEQDEF